MRWIVMVLAMVFAGLAVAEEKENPFPDDPFPLTQEQMKGMKTNSAEEAIYAAWMYRNVENEKIKALGAHGRVEGAGVLAMGTGWKDHKDKFAKAEDGQKLIALQVLLMAVEEDFEPNPLYIKVQCNGGVYETEMMASPPAPKLGTTTVKKGQSVKGWVVVQVPKDATHEACTWALDIPLAGMSEWLKIVNVAK